MKRVLIVTHSRDLHADAIVPLLRQRGPAPIRLDLDAFPRDYELCQSLTGTDCVNRLRPLPGGDWIDLDQVGAVWVRKPADYAYRSDDLGAQERAYARHETEQALFGVLYSLDCFWMSHPRALRGAQWKGEQLKRAARMGFRVPSSIVTNSPEEVRRFRDRIPGPIVFKSLSTPRLASDEMEAHERVVGGLGTTLVDDAMLDDLDAVAELPCHFQEYIAKDYELRVTVVGERVFAARIASQDDPRTMIDSRDMSAPVGYTACTLPPEVARRCIDFVRSYELSYGAIDLIVTPGGDTVFLENNPAGQFLYVQELVPALPILEAIADLLCEEAACRN
ncbi:RimK family alpha-L-glutamate ligase [Massilia oculi]|jgi:glutathione synthase/RimK-type ligase-like ATP-grasp enzyme|uniref:ATP-grasp domain-containing protein n=1 Tax=Massilia oculi TaxID=945844 RepID=A0A2S2DJB4_9BURK|nr:hypothetical protein [Massilia oculi]AWL05437.1 hypothetical protein DIR46_14000 [Massilia oculi]